ncbi:MAG: aminotransferase class V-fold PLP-dependent enzyme [Brevundimonas sp.]|uniref:aminotransferase class V-fold PLP-dependent enzyme n=1 Tax=Brevundimonas sp. TaxID=1871086 RepID=UPI00391A794A
MSFKPLFSRALALNPGRLHFAAHSHHLWPDASLEGQMRAWEDANRHADRKWELLFGEVWPEARAHVARELALPDPSTVAFAGSTHDFLVRIVSGLERRPGRMLTTDGDFHAFRRQAARWEEAGEAVVTRIPTAPVETLADRVVAAARAGGVDLIVVSQVFFRSGWSFDGVSALADLARPAGPWVVVDGYHSFMAVPTDLSGVADRIFYVSGGYKYAMSGEGAGLLHAPPGYCERPVITGWFAEFGNLQGPPDGVQYRADAGRFLGATYDSTPLYRFNFVRRMLDAEGLTTASIADHARGLQARFQAAIEAGSAGRLAEAEIVNPVAGDGPRARFLALRHPEAQAWRAKLLEANVVTDVREDILRFGFGIYQDPGDVDRAVEVCARVL